MMVEEMYMTDEAKGKDWTLWLGDSCERMAEMADNSVDLSVSSPPFASLYVYSDSTRDLGNNGSREEFIENYGYIIRELLRVTKPGRIACVHVQQVVTTKTADGVVGLTDFRGDVQTESRGVRTIVYQPKKKNVKNDLSYYTYLKDVRYQVLAHFEWNDLREELADDRDENKHHNIAMRSVRQGGRRDIFLGARECQAYVEPCEFGGGEGFYDSYGEWNMGYMFHGFSYPDENPDHNLISRFWMPIMKDGVIRFESPDSPLLDRHIVRHGLNVKEFNLGKNVTSVEEE